MKQLLEGVRRFRKDVYPASDAHFQGLATGQAPTTLFVTCSDSRVDPSLITQTQPGELFILRNAGNFVPPPGDDDGSASAVEYAVDALRVTDIVVCGHSNCGAMGGLMDPEALDPLPVVARWVEHGAPTRDACEHHPDDQQVSAAIRHNAITQLDNLRQHPCVARAVAEGRLALHAWVYDIGAGRVEVVASSTIEARHVV